jgi:uncharacterized protein with HEPN domain
MRPELQKLYFDVQSAGDRILRFTAGRAYEDYLNDELLRSAVERQFEIIGEALARLAKLDHAEASSVPEVRQIIAFRNQIIHGYDLIDEAIVWGIVVRKLPELLAHVRSKMSDQSP